MVAPTLSRKLGSLPFFTMVRYQIKTRVDLTGWDPVEVGSQNSYVVTPSSPWASDSLSLAKGYILLRESGQVEGRNAELSVVSCYLVDLLTGFWC